MSDYDSSSQDEDDGMENIDLHSLDLNGAVPQTEPENERQVGNNAGGFVYKIDDMARLKRFLLLGSESGNYYVTSADTKQGSVKCLGRLLADGKGEEVVKEIVAVSTEGRAAKQGPGLYALAWCARRGDLATKRAAFKALNDVCRTACTLFEFVENCCVLGAPDEAPDADGPHATTAAHGGKRKAKKPVRGKACWGRAMRNAVASWYLSRDPMDLALQVTKYRSRHGWTHLDMIRMAHPKVSDKAAADAKPAV